MPRKPQGPGRKTPALIPRKRTMETGCLMSKQIKRARIDKKSSSNTKDDSLPKCPFDKDVKLQNIGSMVHLDDDDDWFKDDDDWNPLFKNQKKSINRVDWNATSCEQKDIVDINVADSQNGTGDLDTTGSDQKKKININATDSKNGIDDLKQEPSYQTQYDNLEISSDDWQFDFYQWQV